MLNILSAKSLTHLGNRGLKWIKVLIKYKYLSECQDASHRHYCDEQHEYSRKQCALKYTFSFLIANQKSINNKTCYAG